MSDLKHQDVPELRRRLNDIQVYRNRLRSDFEAQEKLIENTQREVEVNRKKWHDAGQRECWIRKYLAEKELASASAIQKTQNPQADSV